MIFADVWLRSTGFPFPWLDRLAAPELLDPAVTEPEFRRRVERSRRALVELMTLPAVTEALFLSNPDAVDRMAGLAAADLTRPTVRVRQRLRLGWSYLQRFCAKNETASFFGPLAWGRVDPAVDRSVVLEPIDPDAGWLLRRRVRFEHWVVEALCARLSTEYADRLPPRLDVGCDLASDDETGADLLRFPLGRTCALRPATARLVEKLVAGERPPPDPSLDRLVAAGVVRRAVEVAPETADPLGAARAAVEGTGPPVHGPVLDALPELDDLRARFERGDLAARRNASARLVEALHAVGVDTTRAAGAHYVGRAPVYEDCQRNLRFTLGGALARDLEARLTPLMRLHRLVAECVAARLHEHHVRVLAACGGTDDAVVFLQAARCGGVDTDAVTAEVRAVLNGAWAALPRGPSDDAGTLDLDDEGLAAVATALRTAYPDHSRFGGVLGVGVVSPDVQLAAPDLAAAAAGRGRLVVGEVHPGVATALQPVALPFLDDPAEALDRADRLLAPGRIVLAASGAGYHRSQIDWPVLPHLYELVMPGAVGRGPAERRIPAGRARIGWHDGTVVVTDRETGRCDDTVTVLSSDLHRVLFALTRDVLGGSRTERITHRGVEVTRRSWRFERSAVPDGTRPAEEFADYVAFRDWAAAENLPRRVFVSADTEVKPVFVDWACPLAVDTFARIAHGAERIRITAMSPDAGELWLTDDHGLHTAEFRMTFSV